MRGSSHCVVFFLSCTVYFIINSGTEKIPTVPINGILNLLTSAYVLVLQTTQYTVMTNLGHRKEILRRLSLEKRFWVVLSGQRYGTFFMQEQSRAVYLLNLAQCCQFTPDSEILPLPPDVLAYLLEDGQLVLPLECNRWNSKPSSPLVMWPPGLYFLMPEKLMSGVDT